MMTWCKRFLFVLLALCFAASVLLTGCGGDDNNSTASDSAGPPASEQAPKQEDEGDLDAAAIFEKSQGKGFTFDLVITAGAEAVSSQHWLQDDNWRSEVQNPSGEGTLVTIFNAGEEALYFYDPQSNTATRMDSNVAVEEEPIEEYDPAKMKYLGRDTVDGKRCVIYEVTEEESTSKVWFWEEHGIPIRVESTVDGQEMVLEYKNIKVGDIPASMFTVPDGVQVIEF